MPSAHEFTRMENVKKGKKEKGNEPGDHRKCNLFHFSVAVPILWSAVLATEYGTVTEITGIYTAGSWDGWPVYRVPCFVFRICALLSALCSFFGVDKRTNFWLLFRANS